MVELKAKELGIEFLGFNIPWSFIDSILCNLIEKGDAEVITKPMVDQLDAILQKFVDSTSVQFDNVGKAKLLKAFTLSMVKKYMPELNP